MPTLAATPRSIWSHSEGDLYLAHQLNPFCWYSRPYLWWHAGSQSVGNVDDDDICQSLMSPVVMPRGLLASHSARHSSINPSFASSTLREKGRGKCPVTTTFVVIIWRKITLIQERFHVGAESNCPQTSAFPQMWHGICFTNSKHRHIGAKVAFCGILE